jgi:hypothetical protein
VPPPKPLGEGPRMRQRLNFGQWQFPRFANGICEDFGHSALASSTSVMSADVCSFACQTHPRFSGFSYSFSVIKRKVRA